ncbi:MAG TPA: DUF1501 domain-containing protein [Lacipirellulaceae bacterium]|nr:DUF1501 domain-containing protein [Lacipirellulaceae bacterium]
MAQKTTAPYDNFAAVTRREFLTRSGGGFGALAASWMLHHDASLALAQTAKNAAGDALALRPPHFAPHAQRVVYLFMHGGPSHVDLFDPKPTLHRLAGQPLPESFGAVMTRRQVAANPLLAPVSRLRPQGASGLEISEWLPEISQFADDLCVIRSCHGDSVNHPQSVYQMNTGSILMGRPSLGSWVSYGLGSENQNMPSFVVLPDPAGGIKGGPPAWGSGYLPATYQGTTMRPGKAPILHLTPPTGIEHDDQLAVLRYLQQENQEHQALRPMDDQLSARINTYELAYRMQAEAPQLVDFSQESPGTLKSYGIGEKHTDEFGTRCLLARRLLESGVRFVQLYSGDTVGWDAHEDVAENHGRLCRRTDKPIAGLFRDLHERGLWDDTLVIWGGEFGRMPMSESGKGRDHNPWGYSVVLGGGAVKGGMVYGSTDEVGLRAAENPVHIRDLHATLLHVLGLNHEELTYFHNGLDERLTGTTLASVIHEILA